MKELLLIVGIPLWVYETATFPVPNVYGEIPWLGAIASIMIFASVMVD